MTKSTFAAIQPAFFCSPYLQIQCLILIQLTSILEAQNSSQVLKQTTKPKPKKKKVIGLPVSLSFIPLMIDRHV
jgi:hypothetical protein